jgi:hypothetical protein
MNRTRSKPVHTEQPFARGVEVEVTEENIRPWRGVVRAVKWSHLSGWWVEIERDDDITLSIPAGQVHTVQDPDTVQG